MTSEEELGTDVDPAAFGEMIVRVGTTMIAAGDSVDAVETSLERVVDAYGVPDVQIAVLPTSLFYGTGHGAASQVQFSTRIGPPLRLDQIDGLYTLVRSMQAAEPTPAEATDRLAHIYRLGPPFAWPVRVLGHGILCAGAALLLRTSPVGVAAVFALGLAVGLMKLPRLPTVALIFPVITSFTVALVVFAASSNVPSDNPVRLLVASLVTFVPGGMLTIGTMELAAGQVVSGASRLVNGFVQLALLAFGILAAAALVKVPPDELVDRLNSHLPAWMPWLGVLMFAVGIYLHFCAPVRSVPWILLVLLVAFAGQNLGDTLFGAELSGFFGALAMTPLVLWIETLPSGPPKLVTFLPGFWLLVPGAAGLIGLTSLMGSGQDAGTHAFTEVVLAIMAIALGVLIGAAAHRAATEGARRFARI